MSFFVVIFYIFAFYVDSINLIVTIKMNKYYTFEFKEIISYGW